LTVYRTAGAWGPGLGVNLTPAQVDTNFYDLRTDVDDLIANPPTPNEISSIAVAGTAMTITLEGGQEFGPLPLPVLLWRWRGEWAPLTLHDVLDSFSVDGSGLFVSLRDHTTAATFDPDAVGASVTAGAFVVGTLYRIATVGTTDFTAIGAASNTVGVDFTSTGAGTGTGTATPKTYYQLIGVGTNAYLGDLVDVDVTGAAANAMLVAVSVGSPATIEWQDRTPVEVTALLSDFVGDTGSPGGGVKGLVPAPADGDAAANKVLRADGTWGVGSTVAALDDLTDVSTAGATVGDLLVAGGSPISWSPSSPGEIGSAISDLPLATLPVAALSLMEVSETDGGSPALYTSKHIRISDLVHTLGSTAVAMGETVTTIAGLTLSGGTLSGNTVLPNSGQINGTTGWIGVGGTPAAQIDLQGSFSAAAWTSAGIRFRQRNATVTDTTSSGGAAGNVVINNIGTTTIASTSVATFAQAVTLQISGPPIAGTNTTLSNLLTLSIAAGNTFLNGDVGIRSGSTVVAQAMLHIGSSAVPGTARTYNAFTDPSNGEWSYMGDWSASANVATFGPDKNGTGTYRPGRWVTGGIEIWRSRTNGDMQIGTGSAIATTATGGFIKIATCAGTPTGVPGNAATGSAEIVYDSTGKKLWIYDNATTSWKGVVVA
jgi:hypothetical protein